MFQLDKIGRRYGAQVLFEGLSWSVPAGARVGLVGPNGCGKTTLLRILAGIDGPDGGAVHRAAGSRVGYLPQEVETVSGGSVLSVVLSGVPEAGRLEERLEDVGLRLARLEPGDPQAEQLTNEYGELRHRFEELDGDRLEARARAILCGLGIAEAGHLAPVDRLSGGWRMRVVLGRLLLGSPDLLLLDEPTNHLDLAALDWLEEFLADYDGSFIVVSHDRYSLNRLVDRIAELDDGRLVEYRGDYEAYLEAKEQRRLSLEQAARQRARELARAERFINRFRYKASKARQVQSRIRALAKREPVETPRAARKLRFGFPPAPRSGDVVVRAEGVAKRFGENTVFEGLDLLLRRGDRVALVGPNGAGKSTLIKLLAGRLTHDQGRLELGHNVGLHYYAQHQLDELDPRATVLEEMERVAPAEQRPRLRKLLGRFLFSGEAVDKRVGVLSGGEKARLALARMLVQPANLLLLDEPTNHLDLPGREVLEEALDEYDGTLVVVSHDRYLINRVATTIGRVGGRTVILHEGDYDTYLESAQAAPARTAVAERPERSRAGSLRQETRRREARERNRLYRARRAVEKRLAPLEAEIEQAEREVRRLEGEQADPEVYRTPDRAAQVAREKAEAESRLDRLYTEWDALAEELGHIS